MNIEALNAHFHTIDMVCLDLHGLLSYRFCCHDFAIGQSLAANQAQLNCNVRVNAHLPPPFHFIGDANTRARYPQLTDQARARRHNSTTCKRPLTFYEKMLSGNQYTWLFCMLVVDDANSFSYPPRKMGNTQLRMNLF